MARLSWNEIEARAGKFADDWRGETYEKGESQSFWTAFLQVFGVDRRRAGGYFEYAVRLRGSKRGYIDMFMPGRLLAEQKSLGRNLVGATGQALSYLDGLADHDLPRAIVVSDFASFQHLDLDTRQVVEFSLDDLPKHVRLFAPLINEMSVSPEESSPVNREAAEAMAALHNQLEASGYTGHKLEQFLVRLVFCLFAEDSGIFEIKQFRNYVAERTSEDGTDVGPRLTRMFEVLNTPKGEPRGKAIDADLDAFKYINGGLFAEITGSPDFDASMRLSLLLASAPNWFKVSPAIFGAMFQGVMNAEARHDLGAHYTSEENILRVIKPLFLDTLYAEFEAAAATGKAAALNAFHDKIAELTFLDPACGSGNFLIVAYRELRRLELKVIEAKQKQSALYVDAEQLRVRVEQFYGIEIDEFPTQIARVAMWLTDHQMNLEAGRQLGTSYTRLPLTDGASIVHGNALTLDWNDIIPAEKLSFIFGNPPFLGSRTMNAVQKAELRAVAKGYSQAGFLDYVTGWYIIAARMMQLNDRIEAAFVSTNSISQGEQPSILWPKLYTQGLHINFAHRTFRWTNAAKGVAAVHCVIVGFGKRARADKQLFDYLDIAGEPVLSLTPSISPYLVAGDEYVVGNRQTQISGGPEMAFGNMAADGGHLLLTRAERDALVAAEPSAEEWLLRFVGARELIQGLERFALWLVGASPAELRSQPRVLARVDAVRGVRLKSARPALANVPHLFAQITQDPDLPTLVLPRHSSESREYVPISFERGVVVGDSCLAIPNATIDQFALLTSRMHMDWLRAVGGRLESRYRYSKDVVYNNFVFPEIDDATRAKLALLGQAVLDARALYPDSTLADLYDRRTMPAELRKAHMAIDAFVDQLYRPGGFVDAADRVQHLLHLNRLRTFA